METKWIVLLFLTGALFLSVTIWKRKQPRALRFSFPHDDQGRRRIAVIVFAGFVFLVVAWPVVHHPYFRLCVWRDATLDECERNEDKAFLLQALRSPILLHSIRADVLCTLMRLRDRRGMKFYLSNDEIDRLRDQFAQEEFTFYAIFYQPFVDEQVNPRLVEMALNPDASRGYRIGAFLQMIEPDHLSQHQADQIFDVWMALDSTNLQAITRRSVLRMEQCGLVSSNLVEKFR